MATVGFQLRRRRKESHAESAPRRGCVSCHQNLSSEKVCLSHKTLETQIIFWVWILRQRFRFDLAGLRSSCGRRGSSSLTWLFPCFCCGCARGSRLHDFGVGNTCGRDVFECTHGGFQRATPRRTHTPRPKRHTHKTQQPPPQQHTETGTESDRQDKTRQDKTRQDKTRQDKTRQDKTRQDKTRQDKTRQDKTRQDKTRQDKTRQDKTRQDKMEEK